MIKSSYYLFAAAVIFLILFAAGCDSSADSPALLRDFFPSEAGNSWIYQGEGIEYASFSREIIFSQDNLAQFTEDNGGTIITAVFQITDDSITRVYFEPESYDPTNLLETGFTPNDNTIILKSPLEIGTIWGDPDEQREIVDIKAQVTTEPGLFEECIKVKTSYPDSVIYEYYSQGVGLVKREFESGEYRVTSTLEKFDIK